MIVINDLITISLNHAPISRQNFKLFHCRHPIHARKVRRRIREVGVRYHRPKQEGHEALNCSPEYTGQKPNTFKFEI